MVLQKRLDYGFNGYQVPDMPRASRSARGKRSFRKKVEGNQMCAFDLLATVAGKLLLEKESCSTPTIKKESQDEEKPFKQEPCDQGSCDEGTFVSKISLQKFGKNCSSKGYNHVHDDLNMGTASTGVETSPCAEESTISRSKKDFENFSVTVSGKCLAERGSPGSAESHDGRLEKELVRQLETEQKMIGTVVNGPRSNAFSSEDQMELDTKPPALVSSDSSVEVPMYGNRIPCSSFARLQDDDKIVSKDDDENSSGCTQPSTITSMVYSPTRVGDRRIRKLLASKPWKVASTSLRDGELSKNDSDVNPVSGSRKACYTRQRTQRCNPFKRRRLFEQSSISTSDGGIGREGVFNSHEKKTINDEATGSACRVASPVADQKSSTEDRDLHVKLNIKSFRVPELVIEIPETATIDSLKGEWFSFVLRTSSSQKLKLSGNGPTMYFKLQLPRYMRAWKQTEIEKPTWAHREDMGANLELSRANNTGYAFPSIQTSDHLVKDCSDTMLRISSPQTLKLSGNGPTMYIKPQHFAM